MWTKRSLAGNEYVYVWADGIDSNVRLEDNRACLLVLIGVTKEGQKELLAVEAGHREGEESSKDALRGVLSGCWACSAGYDLRVVFEYVQHEKAEAILLLALGTHDEVY